MKILELNLHLKYPSFYRNIEVRLTKSIYTKFNIITGNTATGKTTLFEIIKSQHNSGTGYVLDYNKNRIKAISDIDVLLNLKDVDLVIIDEGLSQAVHSILCDKGNQYHSAIKNLLLDSVIKFIFICRSLPSLPIDYKSIYELESTNDILVLKRFYKDYKMFIPSESYLTEDTTTGLEYYKNYFSNVRSSNGNSNLAKCATKDDTIIADGSAIGTLINSILKKTDKMYLPESFEFDLAQHWKPNDSLVKDYMENMPDNTNSIEQYFENIVLPELCLKNHISPYNKRASLCPVLLKVKIHNILSEDKIKRLSSMCSDAKANELGLATDYERAMYVKNKFGDSI